MDKCKYAEELERELSDSGLRIYSNSDDSISIYGNKDDVSIFLTIPVDFQSIEKGFSKIENSKSSIVDFVKSLKINLYNLSVETTLNKLD